MTKKNYELKNFILPYYIQVFIRETQNFSSKMVRLSHSISISRKKFNSLKVFQFTPCSLDSVFLCSGTMYRRKDEMKNICSYVLVEFILISSSKNFSLFFSPFSHSPFLFSSLFSVHQFKYSALASFSFSGRKLVIRIEFFGCNKANKEGEKRKTNCGFFGTGHIRAYFSFSISTLASNVCTHEIGSGTDE